MNILNDVSNLVQDPSEVYHDGTLYGKGTRRSPLKVSATALLPDQTGHSGEYLTTDGSTTSWVAISDDILTAAPSTDLSSSGTKVTLTANENQSFGDVVFINSSGKAQLGDASTIAGAYCVAMCTGTVLANATATYLLQGFARKDA